ncbi:MAG TPA: glycosyltransferase family 39 protein [Candidatus Acidoferrales bacterium]|nr:glycosyltransferase family 39 protein [Candidatus Acidoferrales bacterium]
MLTAQRPMEATQRVNSAPRARGSALALFFARSAPGAILLLIYLCAALPLGLFADVPFHDDWTYAWSVEHLLKVGELDVLDWSIHYPFAQVLWGALFCLPFGFSFSALRISTAALAWLGALALYGTLRELGRARIESLTAAVALVANPVFFVLSYSFMTDVPFVSVANIAFFFLVRGLLRDRPLELYVGCGFALLAFLIRQIAIAIPAAVLLYASMEPSFKSRRFLLPPLFASLAMCLTAFWIAQSFGLTSAYTDRKWVLGKWLNAHELSIPGFLRVAVHMGLALFPFTMTLAAGWYRRALFWGALAFLSVLLVCSIVFTPETPKPLEGMWNLAALGKERRLLRGFPDPPLFPFWLNYPLLAFSLVSAASMSVKCGDAAAREKPLRLFAGYALAQLGLIVAVWLFDAWGSDRYSIVLLPPLLVLLAGGALKLKPVLAGVGVLFLVALLMTWSETRNNRTAAAALAWLRDRGVPFSEIDAGYALNGWHLYAHPENLAPGALRERDVPFVTTNEEKRYLVATSPLPGYREIRRYSWSLPFGARDYSIHVLEKAAD